MNTRSALMVSFLLACGLPLVVFWAWPHSSALEAKIDDANQRHMVFAKSVSFTLSRYYQNVVHTFDAMSGLIEQGEDVSFAGNLLSALAFSHFCLIDPETGKVLKIYPVVDKEFPSVVPEELRREIVKRADSNSLAMTNVFAAPGMMPQFVLARRVPQGIIFASVTTEFIERVASQVAFDTRGHAAVVDSTGRVIAHPNHGWVEEARDLSTLPPVAAILDHAGAEPFDHVTVFHSPALDEDVVAGVARVTGPGWGILVPQPISELEAQLGELRWSAMLVFASGLLISAVIAWGASIIVARPLREAAAAALRIADGEEGVRLSHRPRFALTEIRALRTAFNALAERTEQALRRLTALAEQDPLTGLLNKRAFLEKATEWLETPDPEGGTIALFYFDFDKLKQINDLYGHAAGDDVLRSLAGVLLKVIPGPALLCRASGDEFLALYRVGEGSRPQDVAVDVQRALRACEISSVGSARLSCSVGCALAREGVTDIRDLLSRADQSMYVAKRRGGLVYVYDAVLEARNLRRERLAAQLRSDIASGSLRAQFQPILDSRTGRVFSFETLARWKCGGRDPVAPVEFIGIAEERGFVGELDRAVRGRAFRFVKQLRAAGIPVPVAINVNALELARADFVDQLFIDLGRDGLVASDIVVEVTESIFDDRGGMALETLMRLHRAGVAVHLDDFGKGFSSHGLLHSYQFDGVKVDMRFAGDVETSSRASAIVSSLVELGHRLHVPVTLEGIESDANLASARAWQIERHQGFLFSPPLDPEAAITFALAHLPDAPLAFPRAVGATG